MYKKPAIVAALEKDVQSLRQDNSLLKSILIQYLGGFTQQQLQERLWHETREHDVGSLQKDAKLMTFKHILDECESCARKGHSKGVYHVEQASFDTIPQFAKKKK